MRTFDWTRKSRPAGDFERSTRETVDWTTSPLGPIEQWPQTLRQIVLVSMADTDASAVIYGPPDETAIVYNEPFAELIGRNHPKLQGGLVKDSLVDICPDFDATWQRQLEHGLVETLEDQRVRQDRLGFVEEKSFRWKLLPLIGEDGAVEGSLVTVIEESKAPPRRERSISAVRGFGNVVKTAIDRTASQTAANILRLDEHFSGRSCNCAKLWEMEKKEARFERFGDHAPIGILSLQDDDKYSIETANLAYWDIMAQPPDTKSFLEYIHPDDVEKVKQHLELGSFRQGSYSFQCRLKKWAARAAVSPSEAVPETSPAWILVSAYKDPEQGNFTMCWIIDITSHKSAEAFLRKRMDEALELKRQKERFIDQIFHEIRNPLSAMVHCTDDIIANIRQSSDQSSKDVLEAAQTIAFCTQHIKTIADDVIQLSKLDARLVDFTPASTRPRDLVEQAITIFQSELKAGSIELTFEKDPSIDTLAINWILMDSVRYLQILFNMITNAIKVTKHRPTRKISVRLSAAMNNHTAVDNRVQFAEPRQPVTIVDFGEQYRQSESVYLVTTIEDTGPGLTTDEVSSLFERFAQASPKTESKYGGSGLGLFISRDLTELQGGRLGLVSEAGVGSKFLFSVESKRCGPPETMLETPPIVIPTRVLEMENSYSPITTALPETPDSQELVPVLSTESEKKPRPRRVLVVEDNLINQKVLANQLRKRGYEVSVALHGEEALKQLQISLVTPEPVLIPRKAISSKAFDVVLLDIEMPVMDGITCVQRIRAFEAARPSRSRLPTIAVTANARAEHETAALAAGMDAITTKPYKIEDLVAQIEKACGSAG